MKHKIYNFTVVNEKDDEGWYIAKVPDIQGCATQGKTPEKALERIKEAIQVCLEAEKETSMPLKFFKNEASTL